MIPNRYILKAFVDCYFKALSTQFLNHVFRKIALTYSVSTSDFYDSVHECMFSQERLMAHSAELLKVKLSAEDLQGYSRVDEVFNSNRKLHRLIKRVKKEQANGASSDTFFVPKVFDERLGDVMISTYNSVTGLLGVKTVEETVAEGALAANLNLSELQLRSYCKRTLACESREAFAFPEAAVLGCLFLALQKTSVDTLNKPLENPRQIYRLKERLRKIRDTLESDRFRDALVREVLAQIVAFNQDEYNETLDQHMRSFWISEKGQGLKYLDYAIKRYQTRTPQNLDLDKPTIADEEKWSQTVDKFLYQYKYLEMGSYFFGTIMPLVELVATGGLDKNIPIPEPKVDGDGCIEIENFDLNQIILASDRLDRITKAYIFRKSGNTGLVSYSDYMIAVRVAEVVETYVDNVKEGVVELLECLPETAVAEGQGLKTFWSNI